MDKYALIGGPCSGKTTMINEAKKRGLPVVSEVARDLIAKRGGFPKKVEEIEEFQRQVFFEQLKREESCEGNSHLDFVLLDRGLLDVFAYCNYHLGRIPFDCPFDLLNNRYKGVFLLERIPFQKDGLRIEKSDEEAEQIHLEILKSYENHGYNFTKIPVMDPKRRLDLILSKIKND